MSTIRTDIYTHLTGITSNIYYQFFPDTFDYKSNVGLVYFLRETEPLSSFDKKEIEHGYELEIILQSAQLSTIENLVDQVKTKIYALNLGYSKLSEQDDSFDDELKIWQISLVFDLKN